MEFRTLITRVGLAKIANATALGYKINLKQMAFGDGNGEYPAINEDMTQLVNEVHRGDINNVEVIDDSVIRISQVIPAQVGGFFIREVGVYDEEDDLIAIGVFPESYKPTIEEGATKDIMARMLLRVSNVDSVELKVDPNIVVATLKDLDELRTEFEILIENIDFTKMEEKIKEVDDKVKVVSDDLEEHSKWIHESEDGKHGVKIVDKNKLAFYDGYDWIEVTVDPKVIRDISNVPLRVQVSDKEPPAEDGRVYYNTKDNLFYVARNNQWYRLFVGGDEKLEQDAPTTPPKVEKVTDTTVTLVDSDDLEFRYQGGNWQVSNYFAGLQRNEPYHFEQRYKGDDVYKASPPSPSVKITTEKGTQAAPNPPKVSDIDFDRATVAGESNTEVSLDKNSWYSSPHTFTNLTEETEYTAYARRRESHTHKPSPASTGTKFVTPPESRIYGVAIDNNNANPETRVKYIDDTVGFKPVRGNNGNTDWGSWKDTFIYEKFKPCVVKNGEVQYYLNKEDFTKKEGEGTANLTGTDGDVMIEIGKMWYKLENTGDTIYVRVSDAYQDGFKCLAHTNGDRKVDKIYVGAYLGYEQSGKLRSISGVTPTGDKTIGSFRGLAEANGDRYHQVPFTALTLLQSIMVILLKSTDTQTALGRGHVDDSSSYSKTGNTNKKGMMFGETGGQANSGQMCFMGIEDFWGNKRWWIDGLKYDGGSIKLGTANFNNNASGYKAVGKYPNTGGGYIKAVAGTSEAGYVPTDLDGSSSTYYCDYGYVLDGWFPDFGGIRSCGSHAGGFSLTSNSASYSNATLGSRLFMYGR